MPNVISFNRKRHQDRDEPVADPRHRREGFFDEQDNWHDEESQSPAVASQVRR